MNERSVAEALRRLILILLMAVLLVCPGCWDLRIIEELALIFGVGVDRAEMDEEMLQFTFVHPLFAQEAQDVRVTITISAYSLQQALTNLQHQSDQAPVMGKIETFVFSEETARNGGMHAVLTEFDTMRDNHPTAWVVIVREAEAKEVINLKVAQQARVSIFLGDMLAENLRNGRIPRSDLTTYLTNHYTPGISPVVPVIELTGSGEEKTGILLAGLAVIDHAGKMKGYLNDAETMMYMLLTNNIMRGRLSTALDLGEENNRRVSAFVRSVSLKTKTEIVDDKPIVHVKANVVINDLIVEMRGGSLPGEADLPLLEQGLARDLQGNMQRVIKKAQDCEADIFGFGRYVRINHGEWFQKKSWEREFRQSEVQVDVSVRIERAGTLFKNSN